MKLLVTHASYHCPSCHYVVQFEYAHGSRSNIRKDGTVIGACMDSHCEQFEKRFKIVLPVIEVEEMPIQAVEADLYPDDHEWSARLYDEHRWAWNRAVLIRGQDIEAGTKVYEEIS